MNQELLKKYAELAVVKGVNIQKGQILMINASINCVDMVRAVVECAYEHGAKEVVVNYKDEHVSALKYKYEEEETLSKVYPYMIDSRLEYFKQGACILHIISSIPDIYNGLDAQKISKANIAYAKEASELQAYTMLSKTQWSIVAIPNITWANKVFPNDADAFNKLEKAILDCVHVSVDNDPIEAWNLLEENFEKRTKILNDHNFEKLHFKNDLGTDLYVGLAKHHIWGGGSETTLDGIVFNPNMPTEEIFTMPDKYHVNGHVVASKPLSYNGGLIENFWMEFKDGKVVDYDAQKGKEFLQQLIEYDEGSCYLGEVALVPYHSPISESGILFYDTLFDENASCHLALGRAYPGTVEGGCDMNEEELEKAGANQSLTHVDFMFGTSDMQVEGITFDGESIPVFEQGDFVF